MICCGMALCVVACCAMYEGDEWCDALQHVVLLWRGATRRVAWRCVAARCVVARDALWRGAVWRGALCVLCHNMARRDVTLRVML